MKWFSILLIIFMFWGFFYGFFFCKPKIMFLPPFLFFISLNIKFGYETTIKILPKIYNLFTVFSHIVLAIYVCAIVIIHMIIL